MEPLSLEASYAFCHRLMQQAARNFYYGMRLLPQDKRQAMYALYSFMRLADDIADDPSPDVSDPTRRRAALEQWRTATHAAIGGDTRGHPLWPAFADAVRRFGIPASVFDDAIDGQVQDLMQTQYQTFDELYAYCYRVASTVGIASLHIWGFGGNTAALKLAEYRGIALQLTNILRDLKEDAQRGRRYVPAEDLDRFGLRGWMATDAVVPPGYDQMMQFQSQRARGYYVQSADLEEMVDADARPTLRIMTEIYRGILDRIAADPRRALEQRVSLPAWRKLAVVARHTWRARTMRRTAGGRMDQA
jgi:phytoene synthase